MSTNSETLSKDELTQLGEDLKLVADNTTQIATLSQRAADTAEQGSGALNDVQKTLMKFADSTREINTLLEQINLLSQQVHILGVNAAIEAANAGEQGSGFTIIAEEMRRIAGQVKETSVGVQSIMELSGALADETVSAIGVASENLEVLEVTADLSIQLNQDNSEKMARNLAQLEHLTDTKDDTF